jgi:hypothetical protein
MTAPSLWRDFAVRYTFCIYCILMLAFATMSKYISHLNFWTCFQSSEMGRPLPTSHLYQWRALPIHSLLLSLSISDDRECSPSVLCSSTPKHLNQWRALPINLALIHFEASEPMGSSPHPLCTLPPKSIWNDREHSPSFLPSSTLKHLQRYRVLPIQKYSNSLPQLLLR